MPYTPPAGDNVNITFLGGYTPPSGDNVDFLSGVVAVITIESVSRNKIYDDELNSGFNTSVVRWRSNLAGPYRIEVGGNGAESGELLISGNTLENFSVRTDLTDSVMEALSTFSGAGSYRFNVYVKSVDNVWTPYGQV